MSVCLRLRPLYLGSRASPWRSGKLTGFDWRFPVSQVPLPKGFLGLVPHPRIHPRSSSRAIKVFKVLGLLGQLTFCGEHLENWRPS